MLRYRGLEGLRWLIRMTATSEGESAMSGPITRARLLEADLY